MKKITCRNWELMEKINEKIKYWDDMIDYYLECENSEKLAQAGKTYRAWKKLYYRIWNYK